MEGLLKAFASLVEENQYGVHAAAVMQHGEFLEEYRVVPDDTRQQDCAVFPGAFTTESVHRTACAFSARSSAYGAGTGSSADDVEPARTD